MLAITAKLFYNFFMYNKRIEHPMNLQMYVLLIFNHCYIHTCFFLHYFVLPGKDFPDNLLPTALGFSALLFCTLYL